MYYGLLPLPEEETEVQALMLPPLTTGSLTAVTRVQFPAREAFLLPLPLPPTNSPAGPHQPLLPCGSDGKEPACSAGDLGSIPGLERSSGEGHGNPLQYSCPENPMDGGAWRATVPGVTKSRTQLSD